jgi:hypothetical protein
MGLTPFIAVIDFSLSKDRGLANRKFLWNKSSGPARLYQLNELSGGSPLYKMRVLIPFEGYMEMSLQDYGALGEIIGSIAVLATLIYLAVQLKQANVTTHRQIYGQSATAVSEFWLNLAREPELYHSYRSLLLSPENLNQEQSGRGMLVLDSYLSLMESYYLHNMEYGETLSQERWARILNQILNTPGGIHYWSRRKSFFHAEFSDYIENLIDQGSQSTLE